MNYCMHIRIEFFFSLVVLPLFRKVASFFRTFEGDPGFLPHRGGMLYIGT